MKNYKIEINGRGSEVVLGILSEEQVKTINDTVEEMGFDSPVDFFNDSELLEKYGIPEWSQNDVYYHGYGAHYFDSTIKVTDEQDNVILESDVSEISFDDDVEAVTFEEKYYTVMDFEYKPIIASVSEDSGLCFSTTIELQDDEKFDINKLSLSVDEIYVEDDEEHTIIRKIQYSGETLSSDSEDTEGESFTIKIYEQD
jgi:hypothetical protein